MRSDRYDLSRRFLKGRSNAAKLGGAADIKRKLDWLHQPLAYWGGSQPYIPFQPGIPFHKDAFFRPILVKVAVRLEGLRSGIYSVKVEFAGRPPAENLSVEEIRKSVNPASIEILEVTEKLIADATRALTAADKYPKALGKIVKDVEPWRLLTETRLEAARAALRAARELEDAGPGSLAVEECCYWLGPDVSRPSKVVGTEILRSWLDKHGREAVHGRRLAAIVLGQRRVSCRLPDDLKAWRVCGSLLSSWPPDLIARIQKPAMVHALASRDEKGLRLINSDVGAVALFEYLFLSDGDTLGQAIPLLASLMRIGDDAFGEYRRRLSTLVNLVRDAQRKAPLLARYRAVRPFFFAPLFWLSVAFELVYSRYLSPESKAEPEKIRQVGRDIILARDELPKISSVYDAASRSLMGFELNVPFAELAGAWERAPAGEHQDPLDNILHSPEPVPGREREAWKATIAGLAARALALSGSDEAVTGIATWLDACRYECSPGEDGTSALDLAVRSLECWIGHAGGRPANISALGRLLNGHARLLLRRYVQREIDGTEWVPGLNVDMFSSRSWHTHLAESLWVLGRLGPLSVQEAEAVVTHKLTDDAKAILLSQPDGLKDFIGFVLEFERLRLGAGGKKRRADYFTDRLLSIYQAKRDKTLIHLMDLPGSRLGTASNPEAIADLQEMMVDIVNNPRMQDSFLIGNSGMWEDIRAALDQRYKVFAELLANNRWCFNDSGVDFQKALWLTNEWALRGFSDPQSVLRRLLVRRSNRDREAIDREADNLESCFQHQTDVYFSGIVELSAGRLDRLLLLLDHRLPNWEWKLPEDPIKGWEFLRRFEDVREFLGSSLDRKKRVGRVIGFLHRLALALRLQTGERLKVLLERWQQPGPGSTSIMPSAVLPELRRKIKEIAAYKNLAGQDEGMPTEIKNILKRDIRSEIEKLKDMKRAGELSDSSTKRLEKLLDYEQNPDKFWAWMNADLRRVIEDQLWAAKFEALEAAVSGAFRAFWTKLLPGIVVNTDDGDRDNALRLYLDTTKNRQLLKKLLRGEAKGDRSWIGNLSANRAFVAKMRTMGVDMDVWLGEFKREFAVDGDIWTLYMEINPLKVLQMGNLFGTCLSTGGVSSYSTVANAVEANKRVLYIKNGQDAIIGRKLIGLGAWDEGGVSGAALIGFHSYGATEWFEKGSRDNERSPWVKVLFDVSCLEIAAKIGAGFANDQEKLEHLLKRFTLFAAWYNDGPEPFDWWVTDPALGPIVRGSGDRRELGERIFEKISDKDHSAAAVRALLWLGEDALPVMKKVGCQALKREDLYLIHRYSQSSAVRKLAANWLREKAGEGGAP